MLDLCFVCTNGVEHIDFACSLCALLTSKGLSLTTCVSELVSYLVRGLKFSLDQIEHSLFKPRTKTPTWFSLVNKALVHYSTNQCS